MGRPEGQTTVNHLTAEQLVAHLAGDPALPAEAAAREEHLQACAECQAELSAVAATLTMVRCLEVPERDEGYGAVVWSRIGPRLRRARPWWELEGWIAPWRLFLAGGAAALVVAAFVAGRPGPFARVPPPPPVPTDARSAADQGRRREGILLVAVGDYLERSQIALVDLVNSPAGATVDLSESRERARQLITENRLYRETALSTGDQGIASVLDDLERVLVEIANGPSTVSGLEWNSMRNRIEQQGIIFEVRVFGEHVREREALLTGDAPTRG